MSWKHNRFIQKATSFKLLYCHLSNLTSILKLRSLNRLARTRKRASPETLVPKDQTKAAMNHLAKTIIHPNKHPEHWNNLTRMMRAHRTLIFRKMMDFNPQNMTRISSNRNKSANSQQLTTKYLSLARAQPPTNSQLYLDFNEFSLLGLTTQPPSSSSLNF